MSKAPFLPFDVNLDTFIDDLKRLLDAGRARNAALLDIENKTYANFVRPFEMFGEELDQFFTPLSHLNAVNNNEKTQEVYTAALPLLTEYGTEVGQNLDIYNAFKAVKANEYDLLSPEQQRVIDLNLQGFELSGAHLDDATKKRLAEINLRKSELSNRFSQNLLDATNAFEYVVTDPADVAGWCGPRLPWRFAHPSTGASAPAP